MIYSDVITVPPMTPEYRPVEIVIRPGVGRIVRAEVLFPEGSLGTIGIKLLDENRQFAPLPNGWLHDTVSWEENHKLQGPPYRITVRGWSNAIDWPHTVTIRLEITR